MPKNRVVLTACPPFALPTLEKALGGYVSLLHVSSLEAAEAALRTNSRISAVVCGVHFDESRMYDLLALVKREFPHVPFVCVRVLDAEIPKISREALRIAAESMGANGYLDFPSLIEKHGSDDAEGYLRSHVLARLPSQASGG
jgi:hypothetical protein